MELKTFKRKAFQALTKPHWYFFSSVRQTPWHKMYPPPPPPRVFLSSFTLVFHKNKLAFNICIFVRYCTLSLSLWSWEEGSFCFTSTEERLHIRDGDGGKRAREWRLDRWYRPKKTGDTVDRRQNNGSVKAVSPRHCAATSALRNCCFNRHRVTRTMSVALLLRNNPKRKKSNFRSPASPPCSWSLLG